MLNPKNREASLEINGTLSFWGLCMTYIISLFRACLACLSIFMCIWIINVCDTQIYLCMHWYTYAYSACNREIVGSSPSRVELFSRKFWLFQENFQELKMGAVPLAWLAVYMLISRNKYICALMHFIVSNYTQNFYTTGSVFNVTLP